MVKYLLSKHKDLSLPLITNVHVKKKNEDEAHLKILDLGRQRQADPWDSLANKTGPLDEWQAHKRPLREKWDDV